MTTYWKIGQPNKKFPGAESGAHNLWVEILRTSSPVLQHSVYGAGVGGVVNFWGAENGSCGTEHALPFVSFRVIGPTTIVSTYNSFFTVHQAHGTVPSPASCCYQRSILRGLGLSHLSPLTCDDSRHSSPLRCLLTIRRHPPSFGTENRAPI
jgi:hypothetical protein